MRRSTPALQPDRGFALSVEDVCSQDLAENSERSERTHEIHENVQTRVDVLQNDESCVVPPIADDGVLFVASV